MRPGLFLNIPKVATHSQRTLDPLYTTKVKRGALKLSARDLILFIEKLFNIFKFAFIRWEH